MNFLQCHCLFYCVCVATGVFCKTRIIYSCLKLLLLEIKDWYILTIKYFDVLKLHSTGGPCEKPRCRLHAKGRLRATVRLDHERPLRGRHWRRHGRCCHLVSSHRCTTRIVVTYAEWYTTLKIRSIKRQPRTVCLHWLKLLEHVL